MIYFHVTKAQEVALVQATVSDLPRTDQRKEYYKTECTKVRIILIVNLLIDCLSMLCFIRTQNLSRNEGNNIMCDECKTPLSSLIKF